MRHLLFALIVAMALAARPARGQGRYTLAASDSIQVVEDTLGVWAAWRMYTPDSVITFDRNLGMLRQSRDEAALVDSLLDHGLIALLEVWRALWKE